VRSRRMTINKISLPTVSADYAHEQIDPGIRIGHSTVTLSGAKHLEAQRDRPFASLRVTVAGSSRRDHAVMLSGAKHLEA